MGSGAERVGRAERAVTRGRMTMRQYQQTARSLGYRPATRAQINQTWGQTSRR